MIRFSSSLLYSAFLLVQTEEFNIVFSFFPLIVFKMMLLVILSMRTHQCPSVLIPGTEQTLWCWLCGCTWLVSTDITTLSLASSVPWCWKKKKNLCAFEYFWFVLIDSWNIFCKGQLNTISTVTDLFFWKCPAYQGIFCFLFLFVT